MKLRTSIGLAALAAVAGGAGAQSSLPPIRQIGPVAATTKEPLTAITGIRHLPGNKVLVNDPVSRRVLLFDSTLTSFTVVADSTAATGNAYSGRIGGSIPFRSDSTLFVDAQSLSMLVIDPAGNVGRVMSVPRTQDAFLLTGGGFGAAAFDGKGKLVYRGSNFAAPIVRTGGGGPPQIPPQPDTAPVVRVDLATRVVDTVGFIKVPKTNMQMSQDANGRISVTTQINPLPVVDDWAVLPDGTIGFVRGRDYHVDWVNADGSRSSSPKVPFEWQRLTDDDKVAFIDSVKAARERQGATAGIPLGAGQQMVTSFGGGRPAGPPPAGGGGQRVMVFGGDGGGPGRGGAAPGNVNFAPPQITFVLPSELPDYKPPFFAGFMRADADGNLWIRTIPTKAYPGGPIYDVVNRKGELVDRVQVLPGRQIIGFGAGGTVYMTARDEANAITLERARVR